MVSSSQNVTISLDAMGGDYAPEVVVKGADIFLSKYPNTKFLLFGDESLIKPHLDKLPKLEAASELHHTDEVIAPDAKPSIALRQGRNSSMTKAINAVKNEKAHAVVSAGNTGALMAIAKLALRTLPGIDRPAIATALPNLKNGCILLDLGANVECTAKNYIQFAVMGEAFAKIIFELNKPTVGLLNIGSEEAKGHETIKQASQMLREDNMGMNFIGYVEGNGIGEGDADVIVTDGFTGNVALKSVEGTANICSKYLKEALTSSPLSMLGGMLAKNSLKKMFKKIDPRLYNGALLLGLNGITVKSHGGSDEIGTANAIKVAYELATKNINNKIIETLKEHPIAENE